MPAPRADFACLAPKCQQDGAATIYELPITATRCPVCGSKRVKRLYNAVNVGSANARAHEKILEASTIPAQLDAAKAAAEAKRESPIMKMGGAGALGAVRAFPGAAAGSQGVAIPLIRSFSGPKPGAGSRDG